jgi:RNA polymerase sigma factor (sigma-70 family)
MSESQTIQQIDQWLALLGRGDEAARFRARNGLITAASARLRRLAHLMLEGYPAVARAVETGDILGEAVIRLCRALEDEAVLARMCSARDFLAIAALQIRRELLDLARSRSRSGANPGPIGAPGDTGHPGLEPAEVSSAQPERLALWTEFHRQVESLPDEEREVFDLLWYQELSQVEASSVLCVDERTVRRRWQSARLRLQQMLGGELPFGRR